MASPSETSSPAFPQVDRLVPPPVDYDDDYDADATHPFSEFDDDADCDSPARKASWKSSTTLPLCIAGAYGFGLVGLMKYQKARGVSNPTMRFGQARVATQAVTVVGIMTVALVSAYQNREAAKDKEERATQRALQQAAAAAAKSTM